MPIYILGISKDASREYITLRITKPIRVFLVQQYSKYRGAMTVTKLCAFLLITQ